MVSLWHNELGVISTCQLPGEAGEAGMGTSEFRAIEVRKAACLRNCWSLGQVSYSLGTAELSVEFHCLEVFVPAVSQVLLLLHLK